MFVELLNLQLFNICILSGFIAYIAQFIGYLHFQTRYITIHREFRSQFGVWDAWYPRTKFQADISIDILTIRSTK